MKLEDVMNLVLTLPFRGNGLWHLTQVDVDRACAVNEVVARIVRWYGGAERWIDMCNGGGMDPKLWPLGLPPDDPKPGPKPPEVLPSTAGGFDPKVGEPPYVPEFRRILMAIARQVGVVLLALIVIAVPLAAQTTVTFAWDPHDQAAEITGFKLYQSKQSGVYTAGSIVATWPGGTLTTGQIPQPALGRYFFVLTAYKTEGTTPNVYTVESDYSNEVTLVLKPKPPKLLSAIQTAMNAARGAVKWLLAGGKKENLRILK